MKINIKPPQISTNFKMIREEVVTSDYEKLNNLPQINDVELVGNKTAEELMLQGIMKPLTNLELEEIFK